MGMDLEMFVVVVAIVVILLLRWLPTVVPNCPTSLQYRPINAECALFSSWRQYVTSVEYLELGFDSVTAQSELSSSKILTM